MGIVEFNGNDKCVSALCYDKEHNKYYFLFGKIKTTLINEKEDYSIFINNRARLSVDFIENNKTLYRFMELKTPDSYEDMKKLWICMNEDITG